MVTLQATSKIVPGGYCPRIVVRNARGQWVGSSTGKRAHLGRDAARIDAMFCALLAALSLRDQGIDAKVAS